MVHVLSLYSAGCGALNVANFSRRAGEILKLEWSHVGSDSISVPGEIAKNREDSTIAIDDELAAILERRKLDKASDCDLVFHRHGETIADDRKCWRNACIANGLGKLYCRECRDLSGKYISVLDVDRTCPRCGKHTYNGKYVGRIFHDFRRTACYEMWRSGNSKEDCMSVSGHKTQAMFSRYSDLFSKEEESQRQRDVQNKRREWRAALPSNVVSKRAM